MKTSMRNESDNEKRNRPGASRRGALFTDFGLVKLARFGGVSFLDRFEWNFQCWDPKEDELLLNWSKSVETLMED